MHEGDSPVEVIPIPEVEVDRPSVPELVSIVGQKNQAQ